jgi:hypothetical protein
MISCNKESIDVENGFQSTDFPIQVGNWWKYKVVDSYAGTTDTFIVQVVAELNKESYRCELRYGSSVVDSAIIAMTETTLSYEGLNQNYSYFGNFKLTFPFNEDDHWIGFYNPDTVVVTSMINDFVVNGVSYSPIYNLKRSFFLAGGYSLTQFMMITPEIGIINQSIDLFDGANAQKQNFSLIEFNLN